MTRSRINLSGSLPLWAVLIVYIVLLALSGYVAFVKEPYSLTTDPNHLKGVSEIAAEEKETRQIFFDSLIQASVDDKKKREVALQSFNVILGALLGFLSAIYALALRKDHGPHSTSDDHPPSTENNGPRANAG
jgi:hypothetical protein